MNRYEGSPVVIIERRKGTLESPFSNMNESLTVATDGKVVLSEIPNELNKVIVTSDDNTVWYEIYDGLITENGFKVDYINKIVTFDIKHVGKQLHFKYLGEGNHYYSPHSIYTKLEDGTVIETLGGIIDKGQEGIDALSSINKKLDEVTQATNDTITATGNTISATNDARDTINRGEQTIIDASNKIDEMDDKITKTDEKLTITDNKLAKVDDTLVEMDSTIQTANQSIANVNSLIDDGRVVIDEAVQTTNNAQSLIDESKSVGEFVLFKKYKKNNTVLNNGSTWIALQDTINNPLPDLPVKENAYWRLIALHGEKGDKGDVGAALNILGKLSDESQLPSTGQAGDAYTVNGELYVWSENTNSWENIGNIKGEKGDSGKDADLTEVNQEIANLQQTISQNQQEVTDQLADISINIKSFSEFVVNNDWTEAIRQACAHLKSLGKGRLIFPTDNYNVFSLDLYPKIHDRVMYDFGNTSDIELDFLGSTITVNRTEPLGVIWKYFRFSGAKNIKLRNLKHNSPSAKINGGARVINFEGANENIEISNVYGTGMERLIVADGYDGVSYAEGRIKNIVISNVHLTQCYKPITLIHGVKGIRIENYSLDGGHRAIHLYGCEDVNIDAETNDCNAHNVLFTSYYAKMPLGVRNAKVRIKSKGEGEKAIALLSLHYNGSDGTGTQFGIFENIEAEIIVGDKGGFEDVISIRNYSLDNPITTETKARGHIFRNITISGNVKGGDRRFITFESLFTGDNIENLRFKDIVDLGGRTSIINCSALAKGSVTFDNVYSNSVFRMHSVPTNFECFIINSDVVQGVSDSSKVTIINSVLRGNSGASAKTENKKIVNSTINDHYYINNIIPITAQDDGRWWTGSPDILSRSEILGLNNSLTAELTLSFVDNGNSFSARVYQPSIYRFHINYQNAIASIRGHVIGEVLLRKNSVASTKLEFAKIIKQEHFSELGTNTATVEANVVNGQLSLKVTASSGSIDRIGGVILV